MRRLPLAALTVAALCLLSLFFAPAASADPGHGRAVGHRVSRVCDTPQPGDAGCHALRRDAVDSSGNVVPDASSVPANARTPADIQNAYKLAGLTSGGLTVAIVDAYDAPSAEKDLNTYRAQFGLGSCTTANGCFRKVAQNGSSRLPRANASWAQEISLDLDMVSAACPDCKILLVEASSPSFANLAAAVNYAASVPGVIAISNSYGGSDTTGYASSYNKSGKAVVASSGDNGYGVEAPASFPGVVAAGGTTLSGSISAGWTETAWSGAGSGCSTLNATTWQTGTGCSKKATADVSAVADPGTGVAVYDSYAYSGQSGWLVFGGTSVASPIIASVYALGHDFGTSAGAYTWSHATNNLHDVTSGANGTCTTTKWCTAGPGWDGPTGLGTPQGIGAF